MIQLKKNDLLRILTPGGVLFARDLRKIITMAHKLGNNEIMLGSRQDILFPVHPATTDIRDQLLQDFRLDYEMGDRKHHNIVTSYISVDIMPSTAWVTSGTYHYAVEHFNHKPKLKINITDPEQSLVPLFSGQLNFIASEHEDYWYLYLRRDDHSKLIRWPVMIYSHDIGLISEAIENICFKDGVFSIPGNDVDALFESISAILQTNNRTVSSEPTFPSIPFPYYEGLHKISDNNHWLGLYWRNNRYDITFLNKVCELCEETGSGRILITPWKSLIIKDIKDNDCAAWEYLCGVNGINLRHSSIELNWHLPVLDKEALKLKDYLIREFNKADISTYGLTFSINTPPEDAFTSVVIVRRPTIKWLRFLDPVKQYHIYHSKDFNPHSSEYVRFASNVPRMELVQKMIELSRYYYKVCGQHKTEGSTPKTVQQTEQVQIHQCRQCLTTYNPKFGDNWSGIEPHTSFDQLPESYQCPVCEAPISEFEEVQFYTDAVMAAE